MWYGLKSYLWRLLAVLATLLTFYGIAYRAGRQAQRRQLQYLERRLRRRASEVKHDINAMADETVQDELLKHWQR